MHLEKFTLWAQIKPRWPCRPPTWLPPPLPRSAPPTRLISLNSLMLLYNNTLFPSWIVGDQQLAAQRQPSTFPSQPNADAIAWCTRDLPPKLTRRCLHSDALTRTSAKTKSQLKWQHIPLKRSFGWHVSKWRIERQIDVHPMSQQHTVPTYRNTFVKQPLYSWEFLQHCKRSNIEK